jgi:hypothetical protein
MTTHQPMSSTNQDDLMMMGVLRFFRLLHDKQFQLIWISTTMAQLLSLRPSNKIEWIDNVKWVAEHIDELYPEDTQLTFETVIHMHPYAGCAFSPRGVNPQHEIERAKETADIAKYADAVTVCCLESEALRRQIAAPLDDAALSKVNETTIANLAYMGLHHSMASVRQQCLDTVTRWRRQRTRSRILGELGIMLFVLFVLLYRRGFAPL